MTTKPILVTGASGFLASHIILKLLSKGHSVRGSVRSASRGELMRKVFEGHGADTSKLTFAQLDLTSDDGWAQAMEGVGVLIHTASPFITHIPKDENEVIGPAVEGTKRALNAALASGVERIVLTSSEVAVVRGHPKSRTEIFTANDWSNLDAPDVTPYMKSKTLAEREAWRIMDAADRHDDLTVINPGFILGPLLETDAGTSGAIIQKMMRGKFPGAPNLWFGIVDVRDAADLHIAAISSSSGFGQRILASSNCISFRTMADAIADAMPEYSRALPTRNLPDFLVRIVGLFDRDARGSVPVLGRKFDLEHDRAEEILGRKLIGPEQAAVDMARSLDKLGMV